MARVNKKKLRRNLENKTYTLTQKDIDKIKRDATINAVEFVKYLPVWVLRTKYGFGNKRIREFIGHYAELTDSFNKGYINIDDIETALKEEVGITWQRENTETKK